MIDYVCEVLCECSAKRHMELEDFVDNDDYMSISRTPIYSITGKTFAFITRIDTRHLH